MNVELKRLDSARLQRNLLACELAISIGCVGCNDGVGGDFVLSADQATRDAFAEDACAASELTGIPIDLRLSSRTIADRTTAPNGCDDARPCTDPMARELFKDILTSY